MLIFNSNTEIPKSVILGVVLGTIWLCMVIVLWISLEMYKSSYYKFGPSDTMFLAFTNVAIDTWAKYTWLVIYIIFSCFMTVISGDWVYPWINAVVMNPDAILRTSKSSAYIIVNYFWIINSLYNIFFFALTYTQVDLALFTIFSSMIGGLLSSRFMIYNKNRQVSTQPVNYNQYDEL